MPNPIILASGSETRRRLLVQAGVVFDVARPMVDETAILASMQAEGAEPRDIADALAGHKARKVSLKAPDALVLGCDQVLDLQGRALQKPLDHADARNQLQQLSGQSHRLLSAVVICQDGQPIWRHIGVAQLMMRQLSDRYMTDYLNRNWHSIQESVGCYKLEEEGVRLVSRIDGDYFTVLGLPLVNVLGYLTLRGDLDG